MFSVNYLISGSTFSGILACSDIKALKETFVKNFTDKNCLPEPLEGRPFKTDVQEADDVKSFYVYALLDGYKNNAPDDDDADGYELVVFSFIDKIEDAYSKARELGDKYFEEYSSAYYF